MADRPRCDPGELPQPVKLVGTGQGDGVLIARADMVALGRWVAEIYAWIGKAAPCLQ